MGLRIRPEKLGEKNRQTVKSTTREINPNSTTWLRDTLYTCDGFSARRYFPLLFKIGNDNVTIQGFIKQYFPVLFTTDNGIKTKAGH
jgi:hypothetical protein